MNWKQHKTSRTWRSRTTSRGIRKPVALKFHPRVLLQAALCRMGASDAKLLTFPSDKGRGLALEESLSRPIQFARAGKRSEHNCVNDLRVWSSLRPLPPSKVLQELSKGSMARRPSPAVAYPQIEKSLSYHNPQRNSRCEPAVWVLINRPA